MPLPDVEYTYGGPDTIPTKGAPPGPDMPDLTDESSPGADDGHNTRTSQIEAVRDLAIDNRTEIGTQTTPAAGSLRKRAADLEAVAPTADEKAALAGTGTPSGANVYVTNDDSRLAGAAPYEEEFLAAAGANTFTLAATPAVAANTLSGRNIQGVYRNGVRSRYKATPTLATEYDQTSGNDKIDVVGQTGGEIFTVVYGV